MDTSVHAVICVVYLYAFPVYSPGEARIKAAGPAGLYIGAAGSFLLGVVDGERKRDGGGDNLAGENAPAGLPQTGSLLALFFTERRCGCVAHPVALIGRNPPRHASWWLPQRCALAFFILQGKSGHSRIMFQC